MFTLQMGLWKKKQKLMAADGAIGDKFGESMSVNGDTLVVRA